MLEWTGERFLPWRDDPALAYEHLHRYLYASRFVAGKAVLDLGCGEGYGSALLSRSAARVVGIDIAPAAIEHARSRYQRSNLEFLAGSITAVPLAAGHQFDLVICFEAIEHLEDHQALLSEIGRMLKPDGTLIVSTPNKSSYDANIQEENEFHLKELEFAEFRDLLATHFKTVRFLGQRIYAQSCLWPIEGKADSTLQEFLVERRDSEFSPTGPENRVPLYYIAMASNGPAAPETVPSVLVDVGNELLAGKDRDIRALSASRASQEEALRWLGIQVEENRKETRWLNDELLSLRNVIAELEKQRESLGRGVEHLEHTVAAKEATIASHEQALAWRAGQVAFLEKDNLQLLDQVQTTSHQLAEVAARLKTTSDELKATAWKLGEVSAELDAILTSAGWKLILKLRRLRDAWLPPGSARSRFVRRIVNRN